MQLSGLFLQLTIGAILIAGVGVIGTNLINQAQTAAMELNRHQIETALEMYHVRHGFYPDVIGDEALIEELTGKGYVRRAPKNMSAFQYTTTKNGQNYTLAIKEETTESPLAEGQLAEIEEAFH